MPANPARIGMMVNDGIVESRVDATLRTNRPNAIDEGSEEREMFFDSEADTDAMVDEYWNWRKTPGRIHEAVEIEIVTGIGSTAVTPAVPKMTAVDAERGINVAANIRALAADYTIERISIELLG